MADCEVIPVPTVIPVSGGLRCCVACGETKLEELFHFRDSSHTKRHGQCKPCMAVKQKEYESKNREKINARARKNHLKYKPKKIAYWHKYYAANKEKVKIKNQRYAPKYKEQWRIRAKQYYYDHPEVGLAWKKNNPDKIKEIQRRYRKKNAEKILLKNQKRYALMMGVSGVISLDLKERLMVSQKGICPYCKTDLKLVEIHRDHIIPLTKGGLHCDANIQLTCEKCNTKKGSKDPILFGREMGIFTPSTQLAI